MKLSTGGVKPRGGLDTVAASVAGVVPAAVRATRRAVSCDVEPAVGDGAGHHAGASAGCRGVAVLEDSDAGPRDDNGPGRWRPALESDVVHPSFLGYFVGC